MNIKVWKCSRKLSDPWLKSNRSGMSFGTLWWRSNRSKCFGMGRRTNIDEHTHLFMLSLEFLLIPEKGLTDSRKASSCSWSAVRIKLLRSSSSLETDSNRPRASERSAKSLQQPSIEPCREVVEVVMVRSFRVQ